MFLPPHASLFLFCPVKFCLMFFSTSLLTSQPTMDTSCSLGSWAAVRSITLSLMPGRSLRSKRVRDVMLGRVRNRHLSFTPCMWRREREVSWDRGEALLCASSPCLMPSCAFMPPCPLCEWGTLCAWRALAGLLRVRVAKAARKEPSTHSIGRTNGCTWVYACRLPTCFVGRTWFQECGMEAAWCGEGKVEH